MKKHEYDYTSTKIDVGGDLYDKPYPPDGEGWELVCSTINPGWKVYWFWKRDISKPFKRPPPKPPKMPPKV